jgi:hypothetical protein
MRRAASACATGWRAMLAAALLLPGLLWSGQAQQPGHDWTLARGAQAHPPYRGQVPRASDVVFSPRSRRPDSEAVGRSFGATRIEWTYSRDPAVTSALVRAFGGFGGAVNANMRLPDESGMAKDFDGRSLAHPRMKAWSHGGLWNSTAHPDTMRAWFEAASAFLEQGAVSMQVDDALMQLYAAVHWGGDFNEATLAAFPAFLRRHPDPQRLRELGLEGFAGDYRDYLRREHGIESAEAYRRLYRRLPSTPLWHAHIREMVGASLQALRAHMARTRGAPVPLSMNLGQLSRPSEAIDHFALARHADYAMSETPVDSTRELVLRAATARALALGYVPSIKPRSTDVNRLAIATLYALGGQVVVPWDVYDGNDAAGRARRFFGTHAEYGDLYAFVRAHAALFDGMQQAAVLGLAVPVHRFDEKATLAAVARLAGRGIPFAFIATGGTFHRYAVDAGAARHFKAVLTVNPDADYLEDDLRALRSLPLAMPPARAADLDEQALAALAPWVLPDDAGSLRLYPRARADGRSDALAVHVVDEERAGPGAAPGECRRRIGVRHALLAGRAVAAAVWHTARGAVPLEVSSSGTASFVTVPECVLWGVLWLEPAEAGHARPGQGGKDGQ